MADDRDGQPASPLPQQVVQIAPASAPTDEERKAASKPGLALSVRLATARKVERAGITLEEVRGFTNCLHEGFQSDASETATCCFSRKKADKFYAVKGPWMLCFTSDALEAPSVSVPIPLDGATVESVGERELEIRNLHIKSDFYGKAELKHIRGYKKETFKHAVLRQFVAPSVESRDQWVEVLQSQVNKLRDALARKLVHKKSMKAVGSTGTVTTVNNLAAALFRQYEEDVESREVAAIVSSKAMANVGMAC